MQHSTKTKMANCLRMNIVLKAADVLVDPEAAVDREAVVDREVVDALEPRRDAALEDLAEEVVAPVEKDVDPVVLAEKVVALVVMVGLVDRVDQVEVKD
ncbi:MAG: hypothetical protein ABL994_16065 [Verrucomicrobiales bacterium]